MLIIINTEAYYLFKCRGLRQNSKKPIIHLLTASRLLLTLSIPDCLQPSVNKPDYNRKCLLAPTTSHGEVQKFTA